MSKEEYPFIDAFKAARKIVDLDQLDLKKISIQKAHSIILREFGAPIPICDSVVGVKNRIMRARINEERKFFNSESELSYRNDPDNMNYLGRASLPRRNIFYGTYHGGDDRAAINTLLSEISHIYKQCYEANKLKEDFEIDPSNFFVTIGTWEVVKPIQVASILFDPKYIFNLEWVREGYAHFIEKFKERYTGKFELEGIDVILQYISKEFSKNNIQHNSDYLISAAYAEYVFEGWKMHGINFPSVATEGLGINVALKPSAVEECLEFEQAILAKVEMNETGMVTVTPVMYTPETGIFHSEFTWKRIRANT